MKQSYTLILFIIITINALSQEKKEILLEDILVVADQDKDVNGCIMTDKVVIGKPRNIEDLLGREAGIGIIKRGGYAMEPVLRSFRYEQLNTQFDGGMQMASACSNRMDPLTSRVSSEEIQKIEIIKGPYSVRFGQTLGGILNIITERPEKVDKFQLKGSVASGYEFNGNSKYARGAVLVADKKYDLYVNGGIKDFGNYESGGGQEISSEYKVYDYVTKLGFSPTTNQRLQLSWRQTFADKVLHAGLPMDAKDDKSYAASVDYYIQDIGKLLYAFKAKAYYAFADHWMTNQWRPISKKVEASTGVTSEVLGGRFEFTLLPTDRTTVYFGGDFKLINKDGERYRTVKINPCNNMKMDPPKKFTDAVWQNSINDNVGFFVESRMRVSDKLLFVAGARMDYIHSDIKNPAVSFSELHGDELKPEDELNYSVNATASYSFSSNYNLQLSVGRGTRAPSLLERYVNHLTVGMDAHEYVGTPDLESEINYQADMSLERKGERHRVYVNVFYSHLQNYITAVVDQDLPRKYMPCMSPKFVKRFQNIDEAFQIGVEFGSSFSITKFISINGNIAYTHAQNRTWDEPLPEVPPLAANLSLEFKNEKITALLKGRFAAEQDRVAVSFSEQETPAYEVFDLNFEYRPFAQIAIRGGVNNILNKEYYDHLSRAYKNMPEQSMFYEPGRNFTLGVQLTL